MVRAILFGLLAFFASAAFASDKVVLCSELIAGTVRWLPQDAELVQTVGEGGFAFFDPSELIPTSLREAMERLPIPMLSGLRLMDGVVHWPAGSMNTTRAQRMNWYVPKPLDFFPRSAEGLAWIAARNADADLVERDLPSVAAALAARSLLLLPEEERAHVRWNHQAFMLAQDTDDASGGIVHTDGMYFRSSVPVFGPPTWIVDEERNLTWAARDTWAAGFSGRERIASGTRHVSPISTGRRGVLFFDFAP